MYAVIETGGKQYQVKANDTLFIEKLNVEAEDSIVFVRHMPTLWKKPAFRCRVRRKRAT